MPSCRSARPPARKPPRDSAGPLLHQPAQHQHGPHCAHIQQRRKTEKQRRQQSRSQPRQRRSPWKSKYRVHRKQLAKNRRKRSHHSHARGHAQQSAGQPKPQRLQQKNAQQICRARANRFQNRQHVHALLKMRMHRHRDANRAQHHRHQANQTQDRSRIIEPLAQRRIAFLEVHHLRVGQRRFNLLCALSAMIALSAEASPEAAGSLGFPAPAVPSCQARRARS